MADKYGDVNYNDVQAGQRFQVEQQAAGNVAATRAVQTGLVQQDTGTVAKFFQEEKEQSARQAAVDDARAQTAHIKRSMQLQRDNFDTSLANDRRLAKMDAAASQTLLGKEKQIQLDSFGRKQLSERQLMDWYNTRAASEEDWANYQQRASQIYERKIMMLQQAYRVIEQEEKQQFQKWGQAVDQDVKTTLAERKAAIEKKIQQAKAKAANGAAMAGALMSIGGTVAAVGGPVGWVVGGAMVAGGAIMSYQQSQQAKKDANTK